MAKPHFCHVQMPVCTNKSVLFSAPGGLHRLWEDYLGAGERGSSWGAQRLPGNEVGMSRPPDTGLIIS